MNLKTPEHIRGQHLDDKMRLKISNKKEKVLSLQINIQSPRYDENGKPVYLDESEDVYDNPHHGYFNIDLLDEEYLDSQPYLGEGSEDGEPKPMKTEQDLQNDIMKHLNIDFDFENDNVGSQDEVGSINSDTKMPIIDYRESMRDSIPGSRLPANSLQ